MIRVTTNPQSRMKRRLTGPPSVPRQIRRKVSARDRCSQYSVAARAAMTTVSASISIQRLLAPRATRGAAPSNPPALSSEEETEADTLCQKSEVAMYSSQTRLLEPWQTDELIGSCFTREWLSNPRHLLQARGEFCFHKVHAGSRTPRAVLYCLQCMRRQSMPRRTARKFRYAKRNASGNGCRHKLPCQFLKTPVVFTSVGDTKTESPGEGGECNSIGLLCDYEVINMAMPKVTCSHPSSKTVLYSGPRMRESPPAVRNREPCPGAGRARCPPAARQSACRG